LNRQAQRQKVPIRQDELSCFGYAQYRFSKESFVAPSMHVGQLDSDSFGMTEFLAGKG